MPLATLVVLVLPPGSEGSTDAEAIGLQAPLLRFSGMPMWQVSGHVLTHRIDQQRAGVFGA